MGDLVKLSVGSRVCDLSVGDEEDDGIGLALSVGYGVGALCILSVGNEEGDWIGLYVGYGCGNLVGDSIGGCGLSSYDVVDEVAEDFHGNGGGWW